MAQINWIQRIISVFATQFLALRIVTYDLSAVSIIEFGLSGSLRPDIGDLAFPRLLLVLTLLSTSRF